MLVQDEEGERRNPLVAGVSIRSCEHEFALAHPPFNLTVCPPLRRDALGQRRGPSERCCGLRVRKSRLKSDDDRQERLLVGTKVHFKLIEKVRSQFALQLNPLIEHAGADRQAQLICVIVKRAEE